MAGSKPEEMHLAWAAIHKRLLGILRRTRVKTGEIHSLVSDSERLFLRNGRKTCLFGRSATAGVEGRPRGGKRAELRTRPPFGGRLVPVFSNSIPDNTHFAKLQLITQTDCLVPRSVTLNEVKGLDHQDSSLRSE
jgi:hypothetical protein